MCWWRHRGAQKKSILRNSGGYLSLASMFTQSLTLLVLEINATGFNYQNEDEKVTLSFPSALQKGKKVVVLVLVVTPCSTAVDEIPDTPALLSLCTPPRLRHVEDRLCRGAERQIERVL